MDVIYFASLVKYFGDTEDISTEKKGIKVNIIFLNSCLIEGKCSRTSKDEENVFILFICL